MTSQINIIHVRVYHKHKKHQRKYWLTSIDFDDDHDDVQVQCTPKLHKTSCDINTWTSTCACLYTIYMYIYTDPHTALYYMHMYVANGADLQILIFISKPL